MLHGAQGRLSVAGRGAYSGMLQSSPGKALVWCHVVNMGERGLIGRHCKQVKSTLGWVRCLSRHHYLLAQVQDHPVEQQGRLVDHQKWCTLSYRCFAPGSTGASRCGVHCRTGASRHSQYRRFAPEGWSIATIDQKVSFPVWPVSRLGLCCEYECE